MSGRETKLREILKARLEARKESNESYSLRAFARDLNTTPATLSRILNKNSNLSERTIKQIVEALGLSKVEVEKLQNSDMDPFLQIPEDDEDHFAFVENWQDAAIASLVETKDFRFDEEWIARRLGISTDIVNKSLKRLLRLGLVREDPPGELEVQDVAITSNSIARPTNKPDKNLLDKVGLLRRSLLDVTPEAKELSDISSITMSIDPQRLPEAKSRIRRFRRSLSKFLDRGEKQEVYILLFGVYPVSSKLEKKK